MGNPAAAPVKGVPEPELIRFFGAVSDTSPIPLGIHNAPEYLDIKALHKAHPNISIIKVEAMAIAVARLDDAVDGGMDIFNGRSAIEMVDPLRAGALGIIRAAKPSTCSGESSIVQPTVQRPARKRPSAFTRACCPFSCC
jgi:hypothetical protein